MVSEVLFKDKNTN